MPKPIWVAALCMLSLAGCESRGDLTSDAFEPGNVPQSRFVLDNADCTVKADNRRDYQLPGITEPQTARHEIYNRAYTACMAADGYVRRDWSPDIPVPYSVDLRP
ncbi:MAG: hypothetical protein WDM91_11430 [Rhizomicrobium sp.]